MTHPIQAALDAQAARDRDRIRTFRAPCPHCQLWRGLLIEREEELDRLHLWLRQHNKETA